MSFRCNPTLGAVDIGGHHVADTTKYRDVQLNGWAAIVDDLVSVDPWQARFLEVRGRAEATRPAVPTSGFEEACIRIHPEKINIFGIE